MPTIVVGVDGSDPAWAALRFALEEAELRRATLRVICAWELPVAQWGEFPPPEETFDRFRRDAEEIVAAAAEIVAKEAPNVECERLAPEGPPGTALLDNAGDASLIVVGTRGHGSVAGLLMGSVSQEVVHKAQCPVVVVPHEESAD